MIFFVVDFNLLEYYPVVQGIFWSFFSWCRNPPKGNFFQNKGSSEHFTHIDKELQKCELTCWHFPKHFTNTTIQ